MRAGQPLVCHGVSTVERLLNSNGPWHNIKITWAIQNILAINHNMVTVLNIVGAVEKCIGPETNCTIK